MSYLLDTYQYVAHTAENLQPECYEDLADLDRKERTSDADFMPTNFIPCVKCTPVAAPVETVDFTRIQALRKEEIDDVVGRN